MAALSKLSIIGLGWLGTSLAHQLLSFGCHLVATKRNAEDASSSLRHEKLHIHSLDIYKAIQDPLAIQLFSQRKVIINIAAGRRTVDAERYSKAIIDTCLCAKKHGAEQILFISTSSVFAGVNGIVDNATEPKPLSESARAHQVIEQYLLDKMADTACVLRLAGLIGPNPDEGYRHPIYALSARGKVSAADEPVNLIHKDDVLQAMLSILSQDVKGKAFNLCSTEHPSKRDYYSWCAKQLGLKMPEFAQESEGLSNRVIDASETIKALDIELKYPSPYDMLPQSTL